MRRKKTEEELREANYRRVNKYQKATMKQIKFVLNKNTDGKMINHLEKVGNISGYLKRLIIADMDGTEKLNCTTELKEWLRTEIMVAEEAVKEASKEEKAIHETEVQTLKRTLRTLKGIEAGKVGK